MLDSYYLDSDRIAHPFDGSENLEEVMQNRQVAETTVGDFWISTVFLVMNHAWLPNSEPLLFETMVENTQTGEWEGPNKKEIQERCSTWNQALEQHERVVNQIKESLHAFY